MGFNSYNTTRGTYTGLVKYLASRVTYLGDPFSDASRVVDPGLTDSDTA